MKVLFFATFFILSTVTVAVSTPHQVSLSQTIISNGAEWYPLTGGRGGILTGLLTKEYKVKIYDHSNTLIYTTSFSGIGNITLDFSEFPVGKYTITCASDTGYDDYEFEVSK